MSAVAGLIEDMVRAGVSPELIGRAAALLANNATNDAQAERRRAADRERKRAAILRNSAESAESAETPPQGSFEVSPVPPSYQSPNSSPKKPPKGGQKRGSDGGEFLAGMAEQAPHRRAKTIGARLPEGWEPNRLDRGLSEFDPKRVTYELAKFRNYWASVSGAGGTKLDWQATFRNWMIKALEDDRKRTAYRPQIQPVSRVETLHAALLADGGFGADRRGEPSGNRSGPGFDRDTAGGIGSPVIDLDRGDYAERPRQGFR
jgi:hypothetical protein